MVLAIILSSLPETTSNSSINEALINSAAMLKTSILKFGISSES